MDKVDFTQWLISVYGNFSKTPPAAAVDAIYRRVRDFPNAFFTWAGEQIADLPSLPGNPGYFLARELWPSYAARNRAERSCQDCKDDYRGTGFYAYKAENHGGRPYWTFSIMPCRCCAPELKEEKSGPFWTKPQAAQSGYTLRPSGVDHLIFLRELREFDPETGESSQGYINSVGRFDSASERRKRGVPDDFNEALSFF